MKNVDHVVQRWISAGIIDKMIRIQMGVEFKNKKIKELKVLNVGDLSFGFIIWLLFCGASISCFIAEVVWDLIKKHQLR